MLSTKPTRTSNGALRNSTSSWSVNAFQAASPLAGNSNGAAGSSKASTTAKTGYVAGVVSSSPLPPEPSPLTEEDIAYGRDRFQRMYAMLDRVRLERETQQQAEMEQAVPRREKVPGQDWCYRCHGGPHLILFANHRPYWPINATHRQPIDNWPAQPLDLARLDAAIDRMIEENDPLVLDEAAE